MSEIWKPVPSLPGLLVSDHGRTLLETPRLRGRTPEPRNGRWDGKRMVIHIRRYCRILKIHRLVCEAFNGPPPFKGAMAMHIDEDSRNNHPSNLKWGTCKENLNAPGFLAYCRSRTGIHNSRVKARLRKEALEPKS